MKGIRKGERGYVLARLSAPTIVSLSPRCHAELTRLPRRLLVLAADITPIDIISHLPVLAEDAQIPYVFVASKEELGHASATKRPTSCVMVCPDQKVKARKKDAATGEEGEKEDDDYRELYDECYKEVNRLDTAVVL